ncbi:MAG TPA: branched-chain amino acid ABC transporter permease [bacterium]|nr:branched-chain amino acid ABC transporter permease [bacterium]
MIARRLGLVAVGGVVLLLPRLVYEGLALDILTWALFATAFDILLGYTGLLSFGHAAFFGAGAYASGLLALRGNVPYPLNAMAGALVAGALSVPLLYLAVRRRGIYFAMITLAFAQMVYYIINEWRSLTGGENGVQGVPRMLVGGLDLSNLTMFYYATVPLVALGMWLCWRIVRSPFGRVLMAIRENEVRARSLGYPVDRYKLLSAVLSCTVSGFAGGMYVIAHRFVALETVHWLTSGTVVMMVLLGGMETTLGPAVGAALVLLLRDVLSTWTDAWGVATGAIFVAVILVFRRGIVGSLQRLVQARTPPAVESAPHRPDEVTPTSR